MAASQPSTVRKTAAIEVSRSQLHLVVGEPQPDGRVQFVTESVDWREESKTFHGPRGRAELTAALQQLVTRHKLQDVGVTIALSGDLCVTRVVTGDAARVRRELQQLEQRSNLYLTLGHGPKTVGSVVRQVDARLQHALLTVVNAQTVDILVEVARQVGITLQWIEPSLLALSRLVGYIGGDKESPALLVGVSDHGVEMGISYRGQLLLDYRPAVKQAQTQVPDLVDHHLTRLQRYCDRYVRFAEGALKTVYLSGSSALVDDVENEFSCGRIVPVYLRNLWTLEPKWEFGATRPLPEQAAAVGSCLPEIDSTVDSNRPNLLALVNQRPETGLTWLVVKSLWPLAAMLLLVIGSWVVSWREGHSTDKIEQQHETLAAKQVEVQRLRRQVIHERQELEQWKAIRQRLENRAWDEVTDHVGKCVPDDVWLEKIQIEDHGGVTVSGACLSEDSLFELVGWLRKLPQLSEVAVNGTREARLPIGRVTVFDLSCQLSDFNDQVDSNDDNG